MLAIGRAMMARPEVMLLDEPSMGLAPLVVQQIFDVIKDINKMGTTVLLVEQNARKALQIADYAYVMETGKIVMEGLRRKWLATRMSWRPIWAERKNSSHISTLTGCNTIQRKGAEKSAPFLMR